MIQQLELTLVMGASLLSPENGDESNFWNVVISGYLDFRTTDKVQKLSDSEPFNFPD